MLSIGLNRAVDAIQKKLESVRSLGAHPKTAEPMTIKKGRFGPYVQSGNVVANLPRGVMMDEITLEEAVALLAEKGKPLKAKPGARKPVKKAAPAKVVAPPSRRQLLLQRSRPRARKPVEQARSQKAGRQGPQGKLTMARRRKDDSRTAPLPSREALRDFIKQSSGRVGKRDLERAFRLGPEHRVALRGLLKDLAGEGAIAPAGHRRFTPPGRLPDAQIVQVTGTDPDGDAIARPGRLGGRRPAADDPDGARNGGMPRRWPRASACWPNCARSATASTRAARSSA